MRPQPSRQKKKKWRISLAILRSANTRVAWNESTLHEPQTQACLASEVTFTPRSRIDFKHKRVPDASVTALKFAILLPNSSHSSLGASSDRLLAAIISM